MKLLNVSKSSQDKIQNNSLSNLSNVSENSHTNKFSTEKSGRADFEATISWIF